MNEFAWLADLGVSTILAIAVVVMGVVLYRSRRNGSNGKSNDSYRNGIQSQLDSGSDGTKTLATRFDEQVGECNKRWLELAEFRGEVKTYMKQIIKKLDDGKALRDMESK